MDYKQPKDIIVLQHDELAYHPERYDEYEPEHYDNIDVCSIEEDLPCLIDNNISFYPDSSRLSAGDTFVRSPYDPNIYLNVAEVKDYIIQEKCRCLFDIARNLGAKEMMGSFCVEQVTVREWCASAKGSIKLSNCDVNVKRTEEDKLNKKFSLHTTSTGKNISIEDWKRAKDKAKAYNLITDPTVRNMLDAMNPNGNGGNHDLSQDISFSMSAETNKLLDIAFKLNAMAKVFNLSAEFHSSTKYRYEIIVNIHFVFPE